MLQSGGSQKKAEYYACFLGALLLLTMPLKWLGAAAAAALIHEFGHAAAVWCMGGKILRFRISPFGACMETTPISRGKELFALAAGPAAGLLFLFLGKWFPRTAICAAIQSIYNLLPIFPLDGGKILRCLIAGAHGGKMGEKICSGIEISVLSLLFFAAVFAAVVFRLGILPLLLTAVLCLRRIPIKTPCKPGQQRVQ